MVYDPAGDQGDSLVPPYTRGSLSLSLSANAYDTASALWCPALSGAAILFGEAVCRGRGSGGVRNGGRPARLLVLRHRGCGHGRAVQVVPMNPILKPPGPKHLKLQYDIVLPTFAFKFNLRRFTTAERLRVRYDELLTDESAHKLEEWVTLEEVQCDDTAGRLLRVGTRSTLNRRKTDVDFGRLRGQG